MVAENELKKISRAYRQFMKRLAKREESRMAARIIENAKRD